MSTGRSRLIAAVAVALAAAWAVLGIAAVLVAFRRHDAGISLIVTEGLRGLGFLAGSVDLPIDAARGRDVAPLMSGLWLMIRTGVVWVSSQFGTGVGLRMVYYTSAVLSAIGAWLVFDHARRTLSSPGAALLAMVLFLLLPATFALSVFWQQSPNLVLLFASLWALQAGRFGWYLVLTLLQCSLHPLAAPVSLAVAWAALRAPSFGLPPLRPGLEDRAPSAFRRFRIAAAMHGAILVLTIGFVAWRALTVAGDGSLSWYFIVRKFDYSSAEPLRNLPTNLLYLLPLGFLPLLDRALLPALLPLLAYVFLGTQGGASGLASLVLGVTFLAFLHLVSGFGPRVQSAVLAGGIAVSLALHALVPWTVLFPLMDGPVGGPFSPATWSVPAREAAVDRLVRDQIPPGSGACVADFARMPLLMERCSLVAPFEYPARHGDRGLADFLEHTDHGRLDAGGWSFLLVDRDRLRDDPELPGVIQSIDGGGRYEVAGEVEGATLYRLKVHSNL